MFKNTFQSGFLSILYSIGSKPLQIWDKKVRSCSISMLQPHSSFFTIYATLNTSLFSFLGEEWAYQENNRQRHSVSSFGGCWN